MQKEVIGDECHDHEVRRTTECSDAPSVNTASFVGSETRFRARVISRLPPPLSRTSAEVPTAAAQDCTKASCTSSRSMPGSFGAGFDVRTRTSSSSRTFLHSIGEPLSAFTTALLRLNPCAWEQETPFAAAFTNML